jgi:large subunit ribosomal protein L15
MTKLNELSPAPGSTKNRMRVGRGPGSGKGKTAGRGVKGQKARSGVAIAGFEGGQMPLHMRMPKRGFRNIFGTDFAEVNLNRIQKAIDNKKLKAGEKITEEVLRKAGLAHKSRDGVRLLGKGSITAKIEIEVAGVSASAKEAVEKAGGSVTTTYQKKVYSSKKGGPGKRQTRRAEAAKKREARKA